MINRVLELFLRSRRVGVTFDEEVHGSSSGHRKPPSVAHRGISNLKGWVRANLVIPTTFGTRHRQPVLLCTIPTRAETLVISLFWVVNIAICCATYELFFPNL